MRFATLFATVLFALTVSSAAQAANTDAVIAAIPDTRQYQVEYFVDNTTGAPLDAQIYVIMEYEGNFYFYPSYTTTPTPYFSGTIPPGRKHELIVDTVLPDIPTDERLVLYWHLVYMDTTGNLLAPVASQLSNINGEYDFSIRRDFIFLDWLELSRFETPVENQPVVTQEMDLIGPAYLFGLPVLEFHDELLTGSNHYYGYRPGAQEYCSFGTPANPIPRGNVLYKYAVQPGDTWTTEFNGRPATVTVEAINATVFLDASPQPVTDCKVYRFDYADGWTERHSIAPRWGLCQLERIAPNGETSTSKLSHIYGYTKN